MFLQKNEYLTVEGASERVIVHYTARRLHNDSLWITITLKPGNTAYF